MAGDETTAQDSETQDSENGAATRRKLLTGMGAAAAGAGLLAVAGAQPAHAYVNDGTYWSWDPWRVYDSRDWSERISSGQSRLMSEFGGYDDSAYVCNLTVVNTRGNGYLAVWNADLARPQPYSSINWAGDGRIVANLGIFDAGFDGLRVFCGGGGSTDFIIDVVGFMYSNLVNDQAPPAVQTRQRRVKAATRRPR